MKSIPLASLLAFSFLSLPLASLAEDAAPAAAVAVDFGDSSSSVLNTKAWAALEAKKFAEVKVYTMRCQELYKAKAIEMQKSLTEPPSGSDKEKVHSYFALNDVGTSYYLLGKALEGEGKKKEAAEAYKVLVEQLPFAQCWDAKGWFWKPADAAKERIKALEFDSL